MWYDALLDLFNFTFVPFYVGLSDILQKLGFTPAIADSFELFFKNVLGDLTFAGLTLGFLLLFCVIVIIRWFLKMWPALPPGLVPK